MSHYDDDEEQALVTPTAAGSRLMKSNICSKGSRKAGENDQTGGDARHRPLQISGLVR